MQSCVARQTFLNMKLALIALAAVGIFAETNLADITAFTDIAEISDAAEAQSDGDALPPHKLCKAQEYITSCHPATCSWCVSLWPDQSPTGCRDKQAALRLQSTGRYFCDFDPKALKCNGAKKNTCEGDRDCVWCSHPSIGQACFSQNQAKTLPTKQICPSLLRA